MVNVNFYLRDKNINKPTPIILRATYNGIKVKCKTNISINPKDWNISEQKPKKNKEQTNRLVFLQNAALKTYNHYTGILSKVPTPSEFQTKYSELAGLSVKKEIEPTKKITLLAFIKKSIEEMKTNYNPTTKELFTKSTILKKKQAEKLLIEFNKEKYRIDFEKIDLDFFQDFKEFLQSKKYSQNTIAKHFKSLKSFLNEATERGINTNLAYKSKRFVVPEVEVDNIYLTSEEIEKIFNLDLRNNEKLGRVRDLFILGCMTGLRFSDWAITPKNIKGKFFEVNTTKTKQTVVIPIHSYLTKIMNKHKSINGELFPRKMSNQKMNVYLKELCQLIEPLQKKGLTKSTKGNFTLSNLVGKYSKVTTHTARRSFATNLYNEGIPAISIMKITGHKTETAFLKYIKVTPAENAKVIELHWAKQLQG